MHLNPKHHITMTSKNEQIGIVELVMIRGLLKKIPGQIEMLTEKINVVQ